MPYEVMEEDRGKRLKGNKGKKYVLYWGPFVREAKEEEKISMERRGMNNMQT